MPDDLAAFNNDIISSHLRDESCTEKAIASRVSGDVLSQACVHKVWVIFWRIYIAIGAIACLFKTLASFLLFLVCGAFGQRERDFGLTLDDVLHAKFPVLQDTRQFEFDYEDSR